MQFLQALVHGIFRIYTHHELPALFGFLLVEEAGIPIPLPGDTLVVLSGTRHHLALGYSLVIIAIATLAVFAGSTILYVVMRRGGRPLLAKYGKFLHLTPRRLDRIEGWFRKHGAVAIVVGRLIPGLRIPTTVMAGISEVPYRVFLPSTLLAAVIWSTFYFYAGLLLERTFARLWSFFAGTLDFAGDWLGLIIPLLVIGGGSAIVGVLRYKRRRAAHAAPLTGQVANE